VKRRTESKVENPRPCEPWKCRGFGKRGKPRAGFPLFPRAPWKSRQNQRDSHISTAPTAIPSLKTKNTSGRAIAPRPRRRSAPPQEQLSLIGKNNCRLLEKVVDAGHPLTGMRNQERSAGWWSAPTADARWFPDIPARRAAGILIMSV
jgi:hypothetical protein